MTKRKCEDISRSDPAPNHSPLVHRHQKQRFLAYFENGQRQLVGSLKIARGIERQKLGRRQKDARNKDEHGGDGKLMERINGEILALKALDLNIAAEFYIARTLCKIKTIVNASIIPEAVGKLGVGPSPYRTRATANVTARLFKSTIVKSCMHNIEEQIRALATIDKQNDQNSSSELLRQAELAKQSSVKSPGGEGTAHSHATPASADNQVDASSLGDVFGPVGEQMSHDDDLYDAHAVRLASSSEASLSSDQELQEDNVPHGSSDASRTGVQNHELLHLTGVTSPIAQQAGGRSTNYLESRSKATTKTTFLPSLASGYVSGSDSETQAADIRDSNDKPKRRNRMGQQARRALAEKQYGAAAKHLRNESSMRKKGRIMRDAGWDARRGATRAKSRNYSTMSGHRREIGAELTAKPEKTKKTSRAKDDSGSLHPSWAAKKKLKQQQSQGVEAFHGKKVVFD